MKRTPTISHLAAVVTLLVMMGSATTAMAENVLRLGRNTDSTNLDPIKSILNVDIWIMNNIHSGLVRANRDATDIIPDLAESWKVGEDQLTYTFRLRNGLQFSDGSDLTVDDVIFSLERLRDDPTSVQSAMFQIMENVHAPDDRTIVIKLREPSAPFLATLAMFTAAIVPEKAVMERGEEFANDPIGAGAFQLEEWRRGEIVVLTRNPYYWDEGLPKLDRVEWHAIADDNTRILKVQGGELDGAILIPFNRINDLAADPDINVHLDPSTRHDHLLLNHTNEWLSNMNVRKALHMAVDQKAITDIVTFGHGQPANSYLPGGSLFYNPDNQNYPYDPDKAKSILESEGAIGITLEHVVAVGDKVDEQIAVMVKDQWAKVGVDLNLQKIDPGQTWDKLVNGEYDVISSMYWTHDIIDPDQETTFVLGMDENLNYYTRYENQEIADLVQMGRVELDREKRREIYYDIQKIAKEEVHWIDLYTTPFRNITRTNVHDFFQNPLGRFMLETTWVE